MKITEVGMGTNNGSHTDAKIDTLIAEVRKTNSFLEKLISNKSSTLDSVFSQQTASKICDEKTARNYARLIEQLLKGYKHDIIPISILLNKINGMIHNKIGNRNTEFRAALDMLGLHIQHFKPRKRIEIGGEVIQVGSFIHLKEAHENGESKYAYDEEYFPESCDNHHDNLKDDKF